MRVVRNRNSNFTSGLTASIGSTPIRRASQIMDCEHLAIKREPGRVDGTQL